MESPLATFKLTSLQIKLSDLFLRSTPGKSFNSVRIWNPLQIPITTPPLLAKSFILELILLCAAIAPVLK